MRPICKTLLVSWVLAAIGVALIAQLGHLGIALAIVPMGISQNMRLEHDRAMFQALRERQFPLTLGAVYYCALFAIVAVATSREIRFDELPFVPLLIMMMFPIIAAMIVNDIKACRQASQD